MEMRDQHDKLDQDKLDKSITVILGDKYIYIYIAIFASRVAS